jgi:hypothetical protein
LIEPFFAIVKTPKIATPTIIGQSEILDPKLQLSRLPPRIRFNIRGFWSLSMVLRRKYNPAAKKACPKRIAVS